MKDEASLETERFGWGYGFPGCERAVSPRNSSIDKKARNPGLFQVLERHSLGCEGVVASACL